MSMVPIVQHNGSATISPLLVPDLDETPTYRSGLFDSTPGVGMKATELLKLDLTLLRSVASVSFDRMDAGGDAGGD